MTVFIHDLLAKAATEHPNKAVLTLKSKTLTYQELNQLTNSVALALSSLQLRRNERIGIYLGKSFENVACMIGASQIGAVFVPINASLKAQQVAHIVNDCSVEVLVTNRARLSQLLSLANELPSLKHVVLVDDFELTEYDSCHFNLHLWANLLEQTSSQELASRPCTSHDMAAILYTSGSTGAPKGVILSHANLVLGAQSVTSYLDNNSADVILAVLPFSFDYGLNQLISALYVGAHCVLLDYLLPRDIIRAIAKHKVTGLAAVPPLWQQLVQLDIPSDELASIRYFTNSGGVLAQDTLCQLQALMPDALPYLMYGLTEAFRSTYLPPEQVSKRPTSIGKAIPNAEVLVLRSDGTPCQANEVGELVHCGPLVSLGYWNNHVATDKRFKKAPNSLKEIPTSSMAVWSGDNVKYDEEGYLYFVSRNDEMLKSSGYRISPTEVEQCIYSLKGIEGVVVFGIPDEKIGQAICVVAEVNQQIANQLNTQEITEHCRKLLPNYMIPHFYHLVAKLPCNANGKIDRNTVKNKYQQLSRSAE